MPMKTIMYLDIDAFFPSVEEAKFPHLKGKPVVVGSGVVASSSYEARRRGVYTGQPIQQALETEPETVVLKGHRATYEAFAREIFDYCRELSPAVDEYLDETFCDLTGTPAAARDPYEVACELKARIRGGLGLTVTIGFGSNRMIAKLAAKDVKPDGVNVVPQGEEEKFMEGRPIGDVPGIGRKMGRLLEGINVTTVGDLKSFPFSFLEKIFGGNGALVYHRIRGREPQLPPKLPRSISRETSFPKDTTDTEEVRSVLQYLVERACRTARALRLVPGTVRVRVRYGDGSHESAQAPFTGSTVLDSHLFEIAHTLLLRIWKRCRLHLVGVTLANLVRCEAAEQHLYESREESLERLYATLDDIRSRYGHSSVIAGASINLMNRLERDSYGYILRTPSLTK